MYRLSKVLNNNGVLAFDTETDREVIILGNGIGFGKHAGERVESFPGARLYALVTQKREASALKIVNGIDPVFLEVTGRIIEAAERRFGEVNRDILLPLADHIALAVKRAKEGKELPNPFTPDIRALFTEEYQAALEGREIIREQTGSVISDDEVGYITLHIHSALSDEDVAQAMDTARLVKESIEMIEAGLGMKFPTSSLGYNRIMTHIRYMIARVRKDEGVNLDMEDYVKLKFPAAYRLAEQVCKKLEKDLGKKIAAEEAGFLGLHIQRATSAQPES